MTTTASHAIYVKSSMVTSNPNLYATPGYRGSRSAGPLSRNESRKQSPATARAFMIATPHKPKEEDLETVLDLQDEILPYDETGKRCYSRACKKLDVVPSSHILSKLAKHARNIDCKHYGLGPKGTIALSIALVVNTRVTSLNLQGNAIGEKGMSYIQKMVSESHTITELNLSDNKIGSVGAAAIVKMLADNRSIMKLEIAGNEFTDADAIILAKSFQEHPDIEHLDLSHNNFGDPSGPLFEEMIAENSVLHTLDLSWNKFRMDGAIHVAKGLKENSFMKTMNFSWNGFGDPGAFEFAKCLTVNSILTSLDLTSCRIGHDGFMKIITALNLNESLQNLMIGKNIIPEEYAEAALSLLRSYPALKLQTLDLSDCTFSPKFEEHIQSLTELHRHITVLYGYSSTYGKTKGNLLADILKEGLECLRDFCKDNNVSMVELFERFDADNSMSVSLQEFQDGLKEAGVPLSLYKIEQFAHALDKDGDGEVDYSEMVLQLKSVEEGSTPAPV